jgi:uncharacterized protein (TIGR02246 family)
MSRYFSRYAEALLGIGATVVLLTCPFVQAESGAVDPKTARDLSNRLWTEYVATLKKADPIKIAAWFTKDAVLLYPNEPELRGRDAIQAHVVKAFEGLKFVELTYALDHVAVVGDEAFTFVTLEETYQQGTAPQVRQQARCGVVWQRQPDNSWQIPYFLVNYLAR